MDLSSLSNTELDRLISAQQTKYAELSTIPDSELDRMIALQTQQPQLGLRRDIGSLQRSIYGKPPTSERDITTASLLSGIAPFQLAYSLAKDIRQPITEGISGYAKSGLRRLGIQPDEPVGRGLGISGVSPLSYGMRAGLKTTPSDVVSALSETVTDPLLYAKGAGEVTGKTLGFVPRLVPKVIPQKITKIGSVIRSGTGISSDSARWIKLRGASKIFTPEKESVDYIKAYLAPKVQKEVEKATIGKIRKAEKLFSKAESNLTAESISLDKTFNTARDILNKYGFLDSSGRVVATIKEREIPRAIKVIAEMYSDSIPYKGKISGGPTVNKGFFKFYRQMLRDVQQNAGAFKRDVQFVIEGLYDDMEKAGATGIKRAKELFRKTTQFEEEFGLSPNQVASKLQSAVNPKETEFIKSQLRPILGKNTDKLFQNIKDHRIAQEFVQRGRPPWTRTGILLGRPGRQVLKSIYESRYALPKK